MTGFGLSFGLGLGLGGGNVVSGGDTISAPTMTTVSPLTNPPAFSIGLPAEAAAGDVVNEVIYSDAGHTTVAAGPYTHTLTSGEVSGGGSVSIVNGALPSGTYYPAAWITRGAITGAKGYASALTITSLLTGLIHSWSLNDGSGATAADDVGTFPLTLNNAPTWDTGLVGSNALTFNGTTQSANTSSDYDAGQGAISIAFWFKTTEAAGAGTLRVLIALGVFATTAGAMRVSIEDGTVWVRCTGSTVNENVGGWNDGSWHHCVITKTSGGSVSNMTISIDGTDRAVTTGGTPATIDMVANPINVAWDGIGNAFTGSLDAIGIWSKVLSSSEITELYNSGSGKEYPF